MRGQIAITFGIKNILHRISSLFQKYFSGFLITGVILGIAAPNVANALKPSINFLLAILVFFPALQFNISDITTKIRLHVNVLLFSIFIIFGLIPVVIYLFTDLFSFDYGLLLGVVLASAAPVMISAPYFTSLIKGNTEIAFLISILTTIISPILIPIVIFLLLGTRIKAELLGLSTILAFVIILPTGIAGIVKKISYKLTSFLHEVESFFTVSAIVLINWIIIGSNRHLFENSLILDVVLPLLAMGIFLDFGIYYLVRQITPLFLPEDISKALSICYGLKNVALVGGAIFTLSEISAFPSSVFSVAHVAMFVFISLRREKL